MIADMNAVGQFDQYLWLGLLLIVAVIITAGMVVMSFILGQKGKDTLVKNSPYECGIEPLKPIPSNLAIKYNRVAMLFVIFDVDVLFFYPWAVVYRDLLKEKPVLILGGMFIFAGILLVGYIYGYKKRAFDWINE
jgi:NADH-quinone oxidoreductase subunit A